jgi:hypothetical protein
MSDDESSRPSETEPPGPQPNEDLPTEREVDPEGTDAPRPGVDKKSEDSFPASDPPSW